MSESEEKTSEKVERPPVRVKEELEQVHQLSPGQHNHRNRKASSKGHKFDCRCDACRRKRRATGQRNRSVIGEDTPSTEPSGISSTIERQQQRALKVEAPNRIKFQCPYCNEMLRMFITKRKTWDESDSLSDAKEEWTKPVDDES